MVRPSREKIQDRPLGVNLKFALALESCSMLRWKNTPARGLGARG